MSRIVVNRNGQPYLLTEHGLIPLHSRVISGSIPSGNVSKQSGKGIGTFTTSSRGAVPVIEPGYKTTVGEPVPHQSLKSRVSTQEREQQREEQAKIKDEQTAQEKEDDEVLSALSAISLKYGMGARDRERSSTKR